MCENNIRPLWIVLDAPACLGSILESHSLTIHVFEIFSNIICLKLFYIGSAYIGHDFG